MTKKQDIYMGMFLTFENTVNLHEAALTKWPEILAARTLINTRKGVINALKIVQDNGDDVEVGLKTAIRTQLNKHFATVVKAIEGNIGEDAGMQKRYKKIRPSDLLTTRDTEAEGEVLKVVQDAEGMLAKLERSDVTTPLLEEMKVLAANYSKAIGDKGTAGNLGPQATADLAKEFDHINKTLVALNDVIKGMPASMAPVQSALESAREVSNV